MFRFLPAGESHGPLMTTIIEGLPAGLTVVAADINADLARRQGGYGRGARQKIETDSVEIFIVADIFVMFFFKSKRT